MKVLKRGKKILVGVGVAAFGAAVMFNINAGLISNAQMDVALANIEALARGEDDNGGWTSMLSDKDCGLYYYPGYGWLPVSCRYDFCLTNASGSCLPEENCCP
jgi:hypothetical protein